MSRQYITTAIDYPNAAPHMGHVLEKVLADVLARWFRLRGDDVQFQIGTDEHGIKIQQTAQKAGMTPSELVEKNVPLFQDLYTRLGISFDAFIRTTDQKKHWPTVQELWKKLQAAGALEKRTYTGLYCSGCERFVTKKDLVDGKCVDHGIPPQEVQEENWFFLLKREGDWLKQILTDGTYQIVPSFRAPETLTLIEQGLEDVSFSRPNSSLSWGIPVPGEEGKQTMYVWCDALTNYFSGVGGFAHPELWNESEITHVIGKDIARFHALIWPAMLKNAKVKLPNKLLIHGFLTSEGQKMSKSIGNVVHPEDVLSHFGGNPDPLRFYLSHEIPVGNDGDFSWKRIDELYTSKLCNLGNLLNRVLVLFKKFNDPFIVPSEDPNLLVNDWERYQNSIESFELSEAIGVPFVSVVTGDKFINAQAPWKAEESLRQSTLSALAEYLRHIALMLLPFIPETAQKISTQLGVPYAAKMLEKSFTITDEMKKWGGCQDWKTVGEPSILFAPLEKKE